MEATLFQKFQIEAAHRLPHLPRGHKCERLHGHSYVVELVVTGPVDPEKGWVMDYADIEQAFAPLFEALDHRYLNEVPGLENPTSERIAQWIWQKLKPQLSLLKEVRIHETCLSACAYRE